MKVVRKLKIQIFPHKLKYNITNVNVSSQIQVELHNSKSSFLD